MPEEDKSREPLTLKRWSARKLAAAKEMNVSPPSAPSLPAAQPSAETTAAQPTAAPELPPVESLTFESDFTAFMKPDVDESLKRLALKKLLHDPRFNVMDGLDTYIDDYSQPDPIHPDVVKQLMQARYIFNPPQTRVNEAGIVEDVPVEEQTSQATADAAPTELGPATIASNESTDTAVDGVPTVAPADLDPANSK
ncbi:MAG TPA: DUF3306 domain-containing protein [Casimicrobiaceae bacterium]|jgi:hypothetical protein